MTRHVKPVATHVVLASEAVAVVLTFGVVAVWISLLGRMVHG